MDTAAQPILWRAHSGSSLKQSAKKAHRLLSFDLGKAEKDTPSRRGRSLTTPTEHEGKPYEMWGFPFHSLSQLLCLARISTRLACPLRHRVLPLTQSMPNSHRGWRGARSWPKPGNWPSKQVLWCLTLRKAAQYRLSLLHLSYKGKTVTTETHSNGKLAVFFARCFDLNKSWA